MDEADRQFRSLPAETQSEIRHYENFSQMARDAIRAGDRQGAKRAARRAFLHSVHFADDGGYTALDTTPHLQDVMVRRNGEFMDFIVASGIFERDELNEIYRELDRMYFNKSKIATQPEGGESSGKRQRTHSCRTCLERRGGR